VADLQRITGPTLDVLEVLVQACWEGVDVHGWGIMKAVKRAGPTVYGVLDRLEDAGWVSGRWEDEPSMAGKPRRRYYKLTATGAPAAQALLAARRPEALRHRPPRPTPGIALLSGLLASCRGSAR
jgi:PadR family transcriptional regulator PadR